MEKKITFSSKIENLREVEKLVDEISVKCKLSPDVYGNVLIATLEAANNAVLHGNKGDLNKNVTVSFIHEKSKLQIIIEDEGQGFDYQNVPDPTAPENVENINGRGVFLMEKLSDEVEYQKEGARVELTFNL